MIQLQDNINTLQYIGDAYAKRLAKLEIATVADLLHHIPFRFIDFRKTLNISTAQIGEFVTLSGEIVSAKNQYTRNGRKIQMFTLKDQTGEIELIWFNMPFMVNSIHEGDHISVAGEVGWFGRKKALIAPEYESQGKEVHTGRLLPIYHETAGISSKWIRKRMSEVFANDFNAKEFLPQKILTEEKLISFSEALKFVHFPESEEQFEIGKRRLSFNELIFMHLATLERKKKWESNDVAFTLKSDFNLLEEFTSSLDFELTNSQKQTIKEILTDLGKPTPMNRLVEGDVGSGKTVVAAAAAFSVFTNGYQTVIMAPTQILAHQHYKTLSSVFEPFNMKVSLITSTNQTVDLENTNIFVGTHALIHKKIDFENVALVVIDEQHRFGVEQRTHLVKKMGPENIVPHVLTMTATPIPRTVAMSLYGDLDLSTLKDIPQGRQKITTWIVPTEKREGAYDWIEKQITEEKIQAYIVCPLIDDSESDTLSDVKAVKTEFEKLVKIFSKRKLGLLHGKLKAEEKDKVLEDFKSGKIDILVSTPVIEVGIDIANATIMMIEGADRFGLAQLHQLRGRVGRGVKKSYCLVMTEKTEERVTKRLEALKTSHSGFELAEIDLKMRGPGELFGTRQSGFPELKIASWQDTELIIKTRKIAENIIDIIPSTYLIN